MAFQVHEIHTLERAPTSPASLQRKITGMLLHSINTKAKVEAINTETGEYRIVLQGTLDMEDTYHEGV